MLENLTEPDGCAISEAPTVALPPGRPDPSPARVPVLAAEGTDALPRPKPLARLPEDTAPERDVRSVLIVGPPRTGTTLLGSLLGGGRSVLSISEPLLMHQFASPHLLRWFFSRLQRRAGLRPVTVPRRSTPPQFFDSLEMIAHRNGLRYLAVKETFHDEDIPSPWQNAAMLDALRPRFASTVGIIRHPYDTLASMLRLFTPWLFGRRHDVLRWIFPRFPHFESLDIVVRWTAANWAHFVMWAEAREMLLLRYEDLVQSPRCRLMQICEYTGVPFEPRMLDMRRKRTAFGGLGDPSILFRRFRPQKPVHDGSIGRGRNIEAGHREIVRRHCAETAAHFGYEL